MSPLASEGVGELVAGIHHPFDHCYYDCHISSVSVKFGVSEQSSCEADLWLSAVLV